MLALGDLHVRGTLLGMEEGFVCVVMGALRVGCALVGGAQVIVEGDLVVERAVLCDYDHGLLSVGGDLRAELVLAEHTTLVRGAMVGTKVDFGGFDVRSPGFVPTVSRERATRSAREVFVPEVINGSGCADGRSLYAQLAAGSPVLKAL